MQNAPKVLDRQVFIANEAKSFVQAMKGAVLLWVQWSEIEESLAAVEERSVGL